MYLIVGRNIGRNFNIQLSLTVDMLATPALTIKKTKVSCNLALHSVILKYFFKAGKRDVACMRLHLVLTCIKDGAYFCYCEYVLRIS